MPVRASTSFLRIPWSLTYGSATLDVYSLAFEGVENTSRSSARDEVMHCYSAKIRTNEGVLFSAT